MVGLWSSRCVPGQWRSAEGRPLIFESWLLGTWNWSLTQKFVGFVLKYLLQWPFPDPMSSECYCFWLVGFLFVFDFVFLPPNSCFVWTLGPAWVISEVRTLTGALVWKHHVCARFWKPDNNVKGPPPVIPSLSFQSRSSLSLALTIPFLFHVKTPDFAWRGKIFTSLSRSYLCHI